MIPTAHLSPTYALRDRVPPLPAGFEAALLACGYCPRRDDRLDLRSPTPTWAQVIAWIERHADCEARASTQCLRVEVE
jgi:hypothetical protein